MAQTRKRSFIAELGHGLRKNAKEFDRRLGPLQVVRQIVAITENCDRWPLLGCEHDLNHRIFTSLHRSLIKDDATVWLNGIRVHVCVMVNPTA